jgi:hypothetical protein
MGESMPVGLVPMKQLQKAAGLPTASEIYRSMLTGRGVETNSTAYQAGRFFGPILVPMGDAVGAGVKLGERGVVAGEKAATGLGAAEGGVPRMRAIFGARDTATKNMIRWAERHPEPGYYDVIGHGSPNSLSGMSADELAAEIGGSLNGQNIRLLPCQTGCPSRSFAQDLANRLRVRVMAPTTDIGASGKGKTLTIFDGGEWRWFDPN